MVSVQQNVEVIYFSMRFSFIKNKQTIIFNSILKWVSWCELWYFWKLAWFTRYFWKSWFKIRKNVFQKQIAPHPLNFAKNFDFWLF